MTKAMPLPSGTCFRKSSRASSPPAEAPMPTMGNACGVVSRVGSGGTGAAGACLRGFGRIFGPSFAGVFRPDDFFMVGTPITVGGGTPYNARTVSTSTQSMGTGFSRNSSGKRIRVFNLIPHINFHRNSPIFPRYSIGSALFSSHDQQYDNAHECNRSGDRR